MKGAVACPQPVAAEAGRQALLIGGNAVDAAIATAFAQFIVDPQMCGVGGAGGLQVYHARTQEHICIEFYGRVPLKATPIYVHWAGQAVPALRTVEGIPLESEGYT